MQNKDYARKYRFYHIDVLPSSKRVLRFSMLLGILFCACVGLVMRLLSLQVYNFNQWQTWAKKGQVTKIKLASERGQVLDRNGKLLAVSVPAGSVFAHPGQIEDKKKIASLLAPTLEIDAKKLEAKLKSKEPFVWLARQIPRNKAEQIKALKLKGVDYLMESKRFYPYSKAASTLVGKVGLDGTGLSGVEQSFNRTLSGSQIEIETLRDGFGTLIAPANNELEEFSLPKGDAVALTVDATLQTIMQEELEVQRTKANSKHMLGILIDSASGEILSMGQAPGVDFNLEKIDDRSVLKNLVLETVFEPGSILKPIVMAGALESQVVSDGDFIDCEGGSFAFGKHVVNDVHPYTKLALNDVMVRSSNIGMTKIGIRLGQERLYSTLSAFGFGKSLDLGLPGESAGILRPTTQWAKIDLATHSFGQGIAVGPLQLVRAIAAIANGGELPRLKIIRDEENESRRIISQSTARKVREMMYGVVEDKHGTGTLAKIANVRVGGKTGTAQKAMLDGRGYMPDAYIASFVGFVDARELGIPRVLTLLVLVDEPNADSIYGGVLAAPAFSRIMQRSLAHLETESELGTNQPKQSGNSLLMPVKYSW